MATIREIIAEKAAAKLVAEKRRDTEAEQAKFAGPPLTIAEKLELAEIDERLAAIPALKPMAAATKRGIVLNMELPKGENRGQATPIAGPPEERALAGTAGEVIDSTPAGADAGTEAWHSALCSLESELCVMRDPSDPEACWLALRSVGQHRQPLLLHRLPWLLWEHPQPSRPEELPF